LGYSELIKELVPSGSDIHIYSQKILTAADRAKCLVQQILTFSRQKEDVRTPQFIGPIIKEVAGLLRASLPSSIELRISLRQETFPVEVNATQIHEVVMNVCTNAAHALNDKGLLEISFRGLYVKKPLLGRIGTIPSGEYAVISVKDNGCGIAEEKLDVIFEPFFTTREVGAGTGMGLSVTYGIVQTHGGDIIINSQVGGGTEFKIFLPKFDGTMAEIEENGEDIFGGNETILFVDDEQIICDVTEAMLQSIGYTVSAFSDSSAAVSEFRKSPNKYDLIITDQAMPHKTGVELAREILEVKKDIPIILCTGYSKTVDEEACKKIGIKAFCVKPLRQNELAKVIRIVVHSSFFLISYALLCRS
jgi:CheY-like chemotaxis protein